MRLSRRRLARRDLIDHRICTGGVSSGEWRDKDREFHRCGDLTPTEFWVRQCSDVATPPVAVLFDNGAWAV